VPAAADVWIYIRSKSLGKEIIAKEMKDAYPGTNKMFHAGNYAILMKLPSLAAHNTLDRRRYLAGRQNAALPPFYLAIPENDKGGHTLDLIGRRYSRVPVDVHFQDSDSIAQLILQLL
jgi:hypothetical protein